MDVAQVKEQIKAELAKVNFQEFHSVSFRTLSYHCIKNKKNLTAKCFDKCIKGSTTHIGGFEKVEKQSINLFEIINQ